LGDDVIVLPVSLPVPSTSGSLTAERRTSRKHVENAEEDCGRMLTIYFRYVAVRGRRRR